MMGGMAPVLLTAPAAAQCQRKWSFCRVKATPSALEENLLFSYLIWDWILLLYSTQKQNRAKVVVWSVRIEFIRFKFSAGVPN